MEMAAVSCTSSSVCWPPPRTSTSSSPTTQVQPRLLRCSLLVPSGATPTATGVGHPLFSPNAKLDLNLTTGTSTKLRIPRRTTALRCRCNRSRDSGDNESRTILDAFFLGKAVAEALNERIESAVGEFLSTIGRLQAEQQKQVEEFQEEVLEKARRAKEQAAREARAQAQGLAVVSRQPPTAAVDDNVSPVDGTATAAATTASAADSVASQGSFSESKPSDEEDPGSGTPVDED